MRAGNTTDPVEAYSVGGGVVQVVSKLALEFYLGARIYWIDLPDSAAADDPEALYAIFSGARVRF